MAALGTAPLARRVAGLRECAGGPEGWEQISRAAAAHRLGGGHDHADDGRGGPGWGAVLPGGRGCIGSCYRRCCTFRLARFRSSVTTVFAGPHSARRGWPEKPSRRGGRAAPRIWRGLRVVGWRRSLPLCGAVLVRGGRGLAVIRAVRGGRGWEDRRGLPVTPSFLGMRARWKAWRRDLDLRVASCCLEHDGQYSRPPSQMTGVPGQPAWLPVPSIGGPGGAREGAEDPRAASGGRGLPAPARAGRRDRHREGEGGRVHAAAAGPRRRPAPVAGRGDIPATAAAVLALAGRLLADRVQLVVMEATSDYWRIWYYLLEVARADRPAGELAARPAAGGAAEDRPVDRTNGPVFRMVRAESGDAG